MWTSWTCYILCKTWTWCIVQASDLILLCVMYLWIWPKTFIANMARLFMWLYYLLRCSLMHGASMENIAMCWAQIICLLLKCFEFVIKLPCVITWSVCCLYLWELSYIDEGNLTISVHRWPYPGSVRIHPSKQKMGWIPPQLIPPTKHKTVPIHSRNQTKQELEPSPKRGLEWLQPNEPRTKHTVVSDGDVRTSRPAKAVSYSIGPIICARSSRVK